MGCVKRSDVPGIEDQVGKECNRLYRRVKLKSFVAALRESVRTRIADQVRSVTPVSPQLDVVEMWTLAVLEYAHQLIGRAVK